MGHGLYPFQFCINFRMFWGMMDIKILAAVQCLACANFTYFLLAGGSLKSRTTSTSGGSEVTPVALSAEHRPEICLQCGIVNLPEISLQLHEISEGTVMKSCPCNIQVFLKL